MTSAHHHQSRDAIIRIKQHVVREGTSEFYYNLYMRRSLSLFLGLERENYLPAYDGTCLLMLSSQPRVQASGPRISLRSAALSWQSMV